MKRLLISLLLSLMIASAASAAKRAFAIEDLYRLKSIPDLAVSPDGKWVVYSVGSTDLPRAKKTTQLWLMDVDGKNNRQLTQGDTDSSPRFSPDGKFILFVRTTADVANLWLLPVDGGEARQLTTVSTGVADPLWSPDGKWIAFATDVYPECNGDDSCNKKIADRWSNGPIKAHMADSLLYRHWTSWKDGTVTHTWVVDVASGKTTDVTPGKCDFPGFSLGGPLQYDFAPDSSEIAIGSKHDPNAASSTNFDLYTIRLGASPSEPVNITAANRAFDNSPRYSPDGRYIAYLTQTQPGYESDLFRIALYDRKAHTTKIVTESFRNWIENLDWSDDSKTFISLSRLKDMSRCSDSTWPPARSRRCSMTIRSTRTR